MNTQTVKTTASRLRAGDVLAGSGFVVTRAPYRLVRTENGRVVVEGNYPGGLVKARVWNRNTTVTVLRSL